MRFIIVYKEFCFCICKHICKRHTPRCNFFSGSILTPFIMTQVLGAQAWYVCHSIEGRLHTGPLSFRAGEGTVGIRSCTQIKNFILKSLTMYMYTGKFIRCVHVSVNTFCVHISLSERLLFFFIDFSSNYVSIQIYRL